MISNYLNVITSEHKDKPKYIETVKMLLDPIDKAMFANDQMLFIFNIEYATGDALDKIGERVGVARKLNFQPSDGTSAILTDDDYRMVIKARVMANHWNGTTEALMENFNAVFNNIFISVIDHQNMTMTVTIVGLKTTFYKELIEHGYIIPKPAGVRMDLNIIQERIFAIDFFDDVYGGFADDNGNNGGEWYA